MKKIKNNLQKKLIEKQIDPAKETSGAFESHVPGLQPGMALTF